MYGTINHLTALQTTRTREQWMEEVDLPEELNAGVMSASVVIVPAGES